MKTATDMLRAKLIIDEMRQSGVDEKVLDSIFQEAIINNKMFELLEEWSDAFKYVRKLARTIQKTATEGRQDVKILN